MILQCNLLSYYAECEVDGIIYENGSVIVKDGCSMECLCDAGMLTDCGPVQLPACPPSGCFAEQEAANFTSNFPNCQMPCHICEPGKYVLN